jgi:hypothetical protein
MIQLSFLDTASVSIFSMRKPVVIVHVVGSWAIVRLIEGSGRSRVIVEQIVRGLIGSSLLYRHCGHLWHDLVLAKTLAGAAAWIVTAETVGSPDAPDLSLFARWGRVLGH